MSNKLIGTDPHQVPTNADLGTLAFQDANNVTMGRIDTDHVRQTIAPSLNLDFANSKKLDSRITFYRDSVGTYFDENGVMRYASDNQPRFDHDPETGLSKGLLIEEGTNNYLETTDAFIPSNYWTEYQGRAIGGRGRSPDGRYNAIALYNKEVGNTYAFVNNGTGAFGSAVATVYAKSGTYTKLGLSSRSTYSCGALFDLQNGVVIDTFNGNQTVQDASIEHVGDGWYRCMMHTNNIGQLNLHPMPDGATDAADLNTNTNYTTIGYILVFAPQLENNRFATSFIPAPAEFKSRDSRATYYDKEGIIRSVGKDIPRYGYKWDGYEFVETGLIIEHGVTNLIHSDFTLNWNQNPTILGPDNQTYASGINSSFMSKTGFGHATNTVYTYSIYAKEGQSNQVRLNVYLGVSGTDYGVKFSLSDLYTFGSYGSGFIKAEIEDVGNGWRRCSMTFETPSNSTYVNCQVHQDVNGNPGTHVWGAQLEAGPAATSFIYTTTSQVTRSADIFEADIRSREQDFARIYDLSWYNPKESTLYGEATSITYNKDVGSNPCLWGITDGTSSNRYLIRRFDNDVTNDPKYSGFTFRLQQTLPDGTVYNLDSFPSQNSLPEWDDPGIHKAAWGIKPGSQIAVADGIDAEIESMTTQPEYRTGSMVEIGFAGSSAVWNGHIRKLTYYPKQLTLEQMKALTENN